MNARGFEYFCIAAVLSSHFITCIIFYYYRARASGLFKLKTALPQPACSSSEDGWGNCIECIRSNVTVNSMFIERKSSIIKCIILCLYKVFKDVFFQYKREVMYIHLTWGYVSWLYFNESNCDKKCQVPLKCALTSIDWRCVSTKWVACKSQWHADWSFLNYQ